MNFCCGKEMWCIEDEGQRVCAECGVIYELPFVTSPLDTPRLVKPYLYKRVQHFINWLKRIQAQDTRHIPPQILELVSADHTATEVKKILKKNGFSKYYNFIPSILYKINGQPPPSIPVFLEKQLVDDFKALEISFLLVKNVKRKNMLPYSYVLHKLLQKCNIQQKYNLRISSNPNTLAAYDTIWKKVCDLLNWPFLPTCSASATIAH